MKKLLEDYAKLAAAKKRSMDDPTAASLNSHTKTARHENFGRCFSETDAKPPLVMLDSVNYEGPPHFLIIGAQKAGTMAAVKNLNKHPDIGCLSEEHYFDLGWHSKTVNSYRSLFKRFHVAGKTILGDKTPEYGYVEECHGRIQSVCSSNTKFIFMIRNPAKRAYSAWNMNIKRNFDVNLFDDCIDSNLKNLKEYRSYGTAEYHYVQRGFYLDQILRFLETFPNRENLLIVVAEHIQKEPDVQYGRIFDFLGARRITMEYEDDHVGSYKVPMSASVSAKLRKIYEPHNERLFQFLGFRIPEWDEEPGFDAKAQGPTQTLTPISSKLPSTVETN